MRAISTGILALAIFVVGVGYFRLWFVLPSPASDARNENVNIKLKLDRDRMKQDAKVATDKAAPLSDGTTKEAKSHDRVNDNSEPIDPSTFKKRLPTQ